MTLTPRTYQTRSIKNLLLDHFHKTIVDGGEWLSNPKKFFVVLATPLLENIGNKNTGCEYYGRYKGRLSGQVPLSNFCTVALQVFIMKRFSIKSQFWNCSIFGSMRINFAATRYQPPSPLERSWIYPWRKNAGTRRLSLSSFTITFTALIDSLAFSIRSDSYLCFWIPG